MGTAPCVACGLRGETHGDAGTQLPSDALGKAGSGDHALSLSLATRAVETQGCSRLEEARHGSRQILMWKRLLLEGLMTQDRV